MRKGSVERAPSDFESALKLANTPQELPLGRVRVIVEIAEAQGREASMSTSAEQSLKTAEQIALELPILNLCGCWTKLAHRISEDLFHALAPFDESVPKPYRLNFATALQ